jgi:hypothetical protein
MLRVGEMVKGDKNALMNVSSNYEDTVNKLSKRRFSSNENKLLACLVLSQTEKGYKKYLIKVLNNLNSESPKQLTEYWQSGKLEEEVDNLKHLLKDNEHSLLKDVNLEDHLDEYEDKHPNLFDDSFDTDFYPTKKKGTLYIRRLVQNHLDKIDSYNDFNKLIVYFVIAQLLVNWEPSCIHLGKMLLDKWGVKKMSEWFCAVWPIYLKKKG